MPLGLSIAISPDAPTATADQPVQFVSGDSHFVSGSTAVVTTLATNRPASLVITGGADQALFGIEGPNLVFLALPVSDGTYAVEVTASAGGGGSDTLALTVHVDATAPTLTSPTTYSLANGATAVGTLTADEPVSWTLSGGEDQALFTLTGADLAFVSAPTGGVYGVEVTAQDAVGNATVEALRIIVAAETPGSTGDIVFFMSIGQSNADGRGDPAELPGGLDYPSGVLYASNDAGDTQQANVGDVTPGYVTQMLQFAIDFTEIQPDQTLVFAQIAAGGTGFSNNRWNPGDDLYDDAVARANGVMARLKADNPSANVRFGGFVWQQGELDRNNPAYASALDTMIAAIRADVTDAGPTAPFLLGEPSGDGQYDAVRAIILDTPNRLGRTAVFRSTDAELNDGDATHFSAEGLRTLGRRAVRAIEVAQRNDGSDMTAPTITSTANPQVANGATAVLTLTANEPVTWSITGGADQALFSLSGATLAFLAPQTSAGNYVVSVRATDAAGNFANQTITVTVAAAADTTPNPFSFTDVTGADTATLYSDQITVSGINAAASVSISGGGGQYRINGGTWTNSGGTVGNGDVVAVRVTSSASDATSVATTLTIGGVSDTFSVTTAAAASDTTPNPFSFTDVTGADTGSVYSDEITVSGINAAAAISISGGGGQYRINGGAWTNSGGTVGNGDVVAVRVTSSASDATSVATTLTIGGVSDTFSVTTAAAAPSGDAEAGAIAHWFFGTDNAAMADMIGGAVLTPVRIPPTHSAGYLALGSDGAGVNGLRTPFDDSAALTFVAVVRQVDAAHQCVVGPTFGDDTGYGTFFNGSQGLKTNGRAGSAFINATLDADTDLSPGTWVFVAVSASSGGSPNNIAFAGDTAGGHKTLTTSASNTPIADKVALGSAYYTSGAFGDPMEVAELIVWNEHKTQSEIEAVYARSRVRLAARGITVR